MADRPPEPEDGFSSNEDPTQEDLPLPHKLEQPEEEKFLQNALAVAQLPPPQEIKTRAYSLQPDILTGWAPKVALPRPIPLAFPDDTLAQALAAYRHPSLDLHLCYLGPRFDNTYSAWRMLGVQFPYTHLGEQRVRASDRIFIGSRKGDTNCLRFQSAFESGNLDVAFRVGEWEYDCFMRVDSNTRGHLHWFYFKVMDLRPHQNYRFNICNFQKAKTLYSRGMQPFVFSVRSHELERRGWRQAGEDVSYSRRRIKSLGRLEVEAEQKYYRLSFSISTDHEGDVLEIAYCPPYTYTRLQQFLSRSLGKVKHRDIATETALCLTLGGLKLPLVTVTSSAGEEQSCFRAGKAVRGKRLIFVMARIHPGESNGSFVMEGFLNWILSPSSESQSLRSNFVFKIIPMANPDGVILGNYRTGLSGRDFNRQFLDPDLSIFVQIAELKTLLQKCRSIYGKDFNLFLDFHGHSVKKNVFTYGPDFPLTSPRYTESRLLPKLIARRTPLFRYHSCVFKVTPGKESTARAVLLRQVGLCFAYTVQTSNGSYYDQDKLQDVAFGVEEWTCMGEEVGKALFDYWDLLRGIQQARMKRKKQREMLLRGKHDRAKRIQSSVMNGRLATASSQRHRLSTPAITAQSTPKDNMLQDLLQEISNEKLGKECPLCSDDEFSEGKSDSENSADDLSPADLKAILFPDSKARKKDQADRKRMNGRAVKMVKEQSFLEDEVIEEPAKPPVERPKRPHLIRKKVQTQSGTPSPVRDPIQPNNSAKIVNISFALNPLPLYYQQPRKQRTELQQCQPKGACRAQYSESFRKTYLSLQREMLKKDTQKKISINSYFQSKNSMRIEEIVGKRIFTEPN